jgi:uncharacterized protein YcfL
MKAAIVLLILCAVACSARQAEKFFTKQQHLQMTKEALKPEVPIKEPLTVQYQKQGIKGQVKDEIKSPIGKQDVGVGMRNYSFHHQLNHS